MPRLALTPAALGQWAVIAGGSSGIGHAIAGELAARGFDLVLVGRSEDRLATARHELVSSSSVTVHTVAADLALPDGTRHVIDAWGEKSIGVFVTTAGEGAPGPFTQTDLDAYLDCINVKVRATLTLTHAVARQMRERGAGAILLASSTGALQGVSGLANNAAAESYVLTLGESLHHELVPHGIGVAVLMPGLTATPGLRRMLPAGSRIPRGAMTAQAVAREGLAALEHGRASHIAGWRNRAVMRTLTRPARTRMMSALMRSTLGMPAQAQAAGA